MSGQITPGPPDRPEASAAAILTLETPELGDRSYLVHDGSLAVAIDPQRDLDRILEAAGAAGVRIGLVVETHLHNDYVTGGLELARRTGSPYVIGGADLVSFDCVAARDGERLRAGRVALRVVATPGHTEGHVAYVLEEGGRPHAVFTGGSLLYGTVGRTDLVAPACTDRLTRRQHESVRRLGSELAGDVTVHPTHGFGSFCSSTRSSGGDSSTIANERRTNPALQIDDPDRFARGLLSGLVAYPAYYHHMGLVNRAGPAPLDLSPPPRVAPEVLRDRVAGGEWVVDLRPRRAFAARHLAGTIGTELSTPFTTYLGWVLPWGMPVTLLAETEDQGRAAQRNLARIGIDRTAGLTVGAPDTLGGRTRSYPVSDFRGLADRLRSDGAAAVLDVRRDDEWTAGHLPGALHIPLPELERRLAELPSGPIWVHCAGGYRASLAASLLDRGGLEPVLVDDEWARAEAADLALVGGA